MNTLDVNDIVEKPKLLVVDDDALLWEMIKLTCESRWFNISLASNWLEAVKIATIEKFKYIIMDIDMPIMNWIEATKNIRLLPNWWDIEIFWFSWYIDNKRSHLCTNAWMNRIFLKPKQLKEIMDFIQEQSQKPFNQSNLETVYNFH